LWQQNKPIFVIPAKAGHPVKPWRYPGKAGCRIKSGMTGLVSLIAGVKNIPEFVTLSRVPNMFFSMEAGA